MYGSDFGWSLFSSLIVSICLVGVTFLRGSGGYNVLELRLVAEFITMAFSSASFSFETFSSSLGSASCLLFFLRILLPRKGRLWGNTAFSGYRFGL